VKNGETGKVQSEPTTGKHSKENEENQCLKVRAFFSKMEMTETAQDRE
jgi:hypothetical protein